MKDAAAPKRSAACRTKSTEMRLAEVIDIYAKLKEIRVFDDPDLVPLKDACQAYVKRAESSKGSLRLGSLGRKLRYDLRSRVGQPTLAMIKGDGDEDTVDF